MKTRKIKRGSEFALVGAGRSGVFHNERARVKNRKARKEAKMDLRKLYV